MRNHRKEHTVQSAENHDVGLGRRHMTAFVLALIVAIAALVAGCGGDDDGDSGGGSDGGSTSDAVASELEADMAVASRGPDLPPIEVGSEHDGQTVFYISTGLNFPFSQNLLKGVEDSAEVLGMSVKVADAKGDPAQASALIDRAVGEKSNAIILQGTDPSAVEAALSKAESAGIPVVSTAALETEITPEELGDLHVGANAAYDVTDAGQRAARFVAADSGCDANVGMIGSSTFRTSDLEIDAFESELKELCPDATTVKEDSPLPQWTTTLGSLGKSMVTSDPEMNYIFPLYDAMVISLKPALKAAGAEDVKIVSYNANLPNIEAIATKSDSEVANVGGPTEWLGWATMDQVVRLLQDEEPVADVDVPLRTFTHENIDTIDTKQPEYTWYGDFDFQSFYTDLWGGGA
jgi:ribose transport system substrate-binding protein